MQGTWSRLDLALPTVFGAAINLIPLLGVAFWSWNPSLVVELYWIECLVFGVIVILEIAILRPETDSEFGVAKEEVESGWFIFLVKGVWILVFAAIYFGLLLRLGGILIIRLFEPDLAADGILAGLPDLAMRIATGEARWAVVAIIFNHLFAFGYYFLMKEEYRKENIDELMTTATRRAVVLITAGTLGGLAAHLSGSPVLLLMLLIGGRIIVDLFHEMRPQE